MVGRGLVGVEVRLLPVDGHLQGAPEAWGSHGGCLVDRLRRPYSLRVIEDRLRLCECYSTSEHGACEDGLCQAARAGCGTGHFLGHADLLNRRCRLLEDMLAERLLVS